MHAIWLGESVAVLESGNQSVNIFWNNPVGDNRARKIRLDIETDAIFGSWANEVFNKIHTTSRFHPFPIGIRISGFDENFCVEKTAAVKREITK